ncbi:UNVERIFIED_CONTAM: hypothetical protein NCL1_09548 [Trichonephila clavipes]
MKLMTIKVLHSLKTQIRKTRQKNFYSLWNKAKEDEDMSKILFYYDLTDKNNLKQSSITD